MKPGPTGLQRLWLATGYSFRGLLAAARHEAAFRLELLIVLPLLVASFWVARNPLEWKDALAFLLEQPEEREPIARAARERVVAEYSVNAVAPKLVDLLERYGAE